MNRSKQASRQLDEPTPIKHPITMVDPVVGFVGRTITDIIFVDEDQDERVEGSELLIFGQKRVMDAFATFQGFKINEFRAQLGDVDAQELDQLVETFRTHYKTSRFEAEILVEDWLQWVANGAKLVDRTKKLGKKAA